MKQSKTSTNHEKNVLMNSVCTHIYEKWMVIPPQPGGSHRCSRDLHHLLMLAMAALGAGNPE